MEFDHHSCGCPLDVDIYEPDLHPAFSDDGLHLPCERQSFLKLLSGDGSDQPGCCNYFLLELEYLY